MKISFTLSTLFAMAFAGCTMAPITTAAEPVEVNEYTEVEVLAAPVVVEVCPPVEVAVPVEVSKPNEIVLEKKEPILISVVGQGVAPMNTSSPAQAYALAKRAAVSDAYRLIAEKVKGVRVDGQDTVENMMVKRSTVRTSVNAMIRNANVVETTFKEGLCEVEMEIKIAHSHFVQ